jgi:hypothetical protein
MVIRNYFKGNNTIIKNSDNNTGKNPVTELLYGGGSTTFSRFIFKVDTDRLKDFYDKGMFPITDKLKHTLKMVNTGTFDSSLITNETPRGKERATSFKLKLFKVNQDWDEGIGFNFDGQKYFTSLDNTYIDTKPSNFYEAKTNIDWVYNEVSFLNHSGVTFIGEQDFAEGNENLEIDISDYVNGILSGDTNTGLGICFPEDLENLTTDKEMHVGFFTRHTNTVYEPVVESRYELNIDNDRNKFYKYKDNKLYLYSNLRGKPTNLDSLSGVTVSIMDNYGDTVKVFSGDTIQHETLGTYCVGYSVDDDVDDCVLYEDVWSGLTINGKTLKDVCMSFEIKSEDMYYNVGDESIRPDDYIITLNGINTNERVNLGDIRKIYVQPKRKYSNKVIVDIDNVEYRIYIKEGSAEHTIIDYTKVHRGYNDLYFLLDTKSLLPSEYFIDVKFESNYEVKHLKSICSFNIVNETKGY